MTGLLAGLGFSVAAADGVLSAGSFTNAADRDCFLFAQGFCKQVLAGEVDSSEMIDFMAFTARTRNPSRPMTRIREAFETNPATHMNEFFAKHYRNVAHLRIISIRRKDKLHRVMTRALLKNGGFTYFELIGQERWIGGTRNPLERPAARDMQRAFKLVDILEYGPGEYMSDFFRRALDRMENVALEGGNEAKKVQLQIEHFTQQLERGEWREAVRSYHALPDSVQREKYFAANWMRAAAKVGPEEHLRALRFLQINFPRDPSVELVTMDALVVQGKFEAALDMVDRIDTRAGGDPYLDVARAMLWDRLKRPEKVKESLDNAVRREPALVAAIPPALRERAQKPAASAAAPVVSGRATTVPAIVPAQAVPPLNSAKLRLQGVFVRSERASAMIGGKTLYEGDMVDDLKLVKIDARSVTLQTPGGELRSLRFN